MQSNLLNFLAVCEKLKCNTRHSWTSSGRQESVAEHTYRLAMLVLLFKSEIEQQGLNYEKIMEMCLLHDLGEAMTGDIPCFNKTDKDEQVENNSVYNLLDQMTDKETSAKFKKTFDEINKMQTAEARYYKALDKIESVMQHNEAPDDTWLPLEIELNLVYGIDEAAEFKGLNALRQEVLCVTKEKIKRINLK